MMSERKNKLSQYTLIHCAFIYASPMLGAEVTEENKMWLQPSFPPP